MNKKDLLDFIERVEYKAIKSVEDRGNKEIEAKKNEILSLYKEKIAQYQDTFNRFSTNLTTLLTDMREDYEVGYRGSYDIQKALRDLCNIEAKIKESCVFKGSVAKLYQARDKELDEVRKNYKKVYMVSKTMTAKKIAEYLEGLGFDLSTLKEDEMKYLSTDIDKSKLFVCGENK